MSKTVVNGATSSVLVISVGAATSFGAVATSVSNATHSSAADKVVGFGAMLAVAGGIAMLLLRRFAYSLEREEYWKCFFSCRESSHTEMRFREEKVQYRDTYRLGLGFWSQPPLHSMLATQILFRG